MNLKSHIKKPLIAVVSTAIVATTALIPAESIAAPTSETVTSAVSGNAESSIFTYDTLNDGIVITGLKDGSNIDDGTLFIPSEIDGKKVVEIGERAFQKKSISTVVFEGDTLEKIGDKAFQGNEISGDLEIAAKVIGASAFAQNDLSSVSLTGVEEINTDAFRDNKITSFDLNGSNVTIGDRAFINNRLSGEIDLSQAGQVGNEAFSTNEITAAKVGDSTNLGNGVFAKNKAWVELKTSSGSDEGRGVVTRAYDSGFGQVVDPVSIVVHYVDQDGKSIAPDERIGDDLATSKYAFEKGKEATFTPRVIQSYKRDEQTITFTPDKDGYEITARYTYVDQRPTIDLPSNGFTLDNGETPTREKLMQGVTAKDKDGNDITSKVKVDTSAVNVNAPGVYDVVYTVTDKNGNERVVTSQVTVGINWAEYEFGGGWQVKDFTFDRDTVTGFSSSGRDKLDAGKTDLWIPPVNDKGKKITTVGHGSFSGAGITKVSDWGKITSIWSSAFAENQITELPNDWGQVTSIEYYAFRDNKITELPDDWGQVTSIGYSAFANNQITELPDDWGKITSIGGYAFDNNKITELPDDWGKITSIGGYAFANNQITELPDDWGKIPTTYDSTNKNHTP